MVSPLPHDSEFVAELTDDDLKRVWTADNLCETHDWLSHVVLHEAAHAIYAAKREIPFTTLTIFPAELWRIDAEGVHMGKVQLANDDMTWVQERPEEALDFFLVGAASENQFLKHNLEHVDRGDFLRWRQSMGLQDATHRELVRQMLREARVRSAQAVLEMRSDISKVFLALGSKLERDDAGHFSNFRHPLVLTSDEISDLIN